MRIALQEQVNHDYKHGISELKSSLTSNSFKPSPVAKAESDKKKAEGEKDGKKKKRNGKGDGDSKDSDNKDSKKKKSGLHCSLCGFEAGHTDLHCWKSHETEEAKAAIEENKKKSEMKKHFKSLGQALAKRSK